MALTPYSQLMQPLLVLPIDETTNITLPKVSAENGFRLNGIIDGKDEAFLDEGSEELFKLVLGPLFDELVADPRIDAELIARISYTALADFRFGRTFAEATWETGGDPKALPAWLASRAPNRAAKRSTARAAAPTTKRPASTTGTRTSRAK